MITYTLAYYDGEERPIRLNSIFSNIESVKGFISDAQLHPDYLMVTEWEGEEILEQINATYYYDNQ
tara:strand:+ start:2485 stop:2682 length:198 start_codon:yes stop_codon:yes gene_type:complete